MLKPWQKSSVADSAALILCLRSRPDPFGCSQTRSASWLQTQAQTSVFNGYTSFVWSWAWYSKQTKTDQVQPKLEETNSFTSDLFAVCSGYEETKTKKQNNLLMDARKKVRGPSRQATDDALSSVSSVSLPHRRDQSQLTTCKTWWQYKMIDTFNNCKQASLTRLPPRLSNYLPKFKNTSICHRA